MDLPKLSIPTYEIALISTGKKIKFRPFLVKEHKILMTMENADHIEVSRIIKELVDVCTFNALDINSLPYFDVEYLFLHIRGKSIGEIVDVNVNCKCGEKIKTSYNIEDVSIEKHDDHTNKIDLDGNCGVIMRYPSIDEAISLFDKDKPENDLIDDIVVASIEAIYTKDNYWNADDRTTKELKDFVNGMRKEHMNKIDKFFKTSPQIVQKISTDCPKCSNHIDVELKGLYNFFI